MEDSPNSFTFFCNYYEALKDLEDEQRLKFYDAIFRYVFENVETEFKGIEKSVWTTLKVPLDTSKQKSMNARIKNQTKTDLEPKKAKVKSAFQNEKAKSNLLFQSEKQNPNLSILEKKKEKKKVEEVEDIYSRASSATPDYRKSVYDDVINYLNQKANTKYRSSSKKTQEKINARLNEGYTLMDFKNVINKKTDEWINTEMEKFLRPETLFGTKFESYLNQKIINNKRVSSKNEHIQREFKDLESLYD